MKFYPAIGGSTVFDHAPLPNDRVDGLQEIFFSPDSFTQRDSTRGPETPGRRARGIPILNDSVNGSLELASAATALIADAVARIIRRSHQFARHRHWL